MSRQDRGQVLAFFALLLPVVLVPLAAYATDVAVVTARAAGLQAATAQAAEAAAQRLDVSALRSTDVLRLDTAAASSVALATMAEAEPGASVESVVVTGNEVAVSASEEVTLPFNLFPVSGIRLVARASARLVAGYDSPSSRLPLPTNNF